MIINEAIESRFNVEPLIALGQAKAALILDPNCGCAKILIAGLGSPNKDWGSRKEKLDGINRSDLSGEEKVPASQVCSTCHGDVANMEKVYQVEPLKMGQCVNCHRKNGGPTDCAACHH